MTEGFNNRKCLIIGASRGIGAAAVRALSKAGARLVIASRDRETLDRLRQSCENPSQIDIVSADLADPASIEAAVEFAVNQMGGLDIAFNNGGVNPPVRSVLADLDLEDFDKVIGINLRGYFVAIKAQINAMKSDGGGAIVNTSSAGGTVGFPMMAAYVASKHGVNGLTRAAALDHARDNIRINAIAPGAVMTDMLGAGSAAAPEALARIEAAIPAGRVGTAEEIADCVLWLASDAAAYVNGAIIPVDGGYTVP
ncbi:MAG: hypothetical protein CME88_02170 [Hirschia sp.]|nr:hypothetical protein [Hirschia sp.]MBF17169.1 hypothetical protein [Hirschia sp.]